MKKRFLLVGIVSTVVIGLLMGGSIIANAKEKVITWKMQTVDPPGLMEYNAISQHFTDTVRKLSNGRLDIKLFPPDGLVPTWGVWDAVQKNMIQISHHFLVYWAGKVPPLLIYNETIAGRDLEQGQIWAYEYGGKELSQKLLAKHGMYYLGKSISFPEHIWSKVPINRLADLKGKKMRSVGPAAEMATALGASVVGVPAGEIYSALERGVVECAEYNPLIVNYKLGFHEVTKYIILPPFGYGGSYDWFVNMKAWQELPDDLKYIVEVAQLETSYRYSLKVRLETQRVIRTLKSKGMIFITWPKEDFEKVEEVRYKNAKKQAIKDPEFKEIFDSQVSLLKEYGWEEPK